MIGDDRDELCPDGCGCSPARGDCRCYDDGDRSRTPRTEWPDGDRASRKVKR